MGERLWGEQTLPWRAHVMFPAHQLPPSELADDVPVYDARPRRALPPATHADPGSRPR